MAEASIIDKPPVVEAPPAPPVAPAAPVEPPAGVLGLGATPPKENHGLAGPPATPTPPVTPVVPPAAPTPPADPSKKDPPTIVAAPPKEGEVPPVTATWPEDWRTKMAAGDSAVVKRLERFQKPEDVFTSFRALEQKVSSGEFKKALPTHATAEEIAEYRKSNNIPDKPDGYDIKVEGIVWGEHDKPTIGSWTEYANKNNLPPDVVKASLSWYAQEQERMVDRMIENDRRFVAEGSDALRADWGNNYRQNLTAVQNLYAGADEKMFDTVMGARTADGRKLGDTPEFLKWQASVARELNPTAALVPAGSSDPAKSIDDRLAEIGKHLAKTPGSPYWYGPTAPAMQKEYLELVKAKEALQARPAARR